MQFICPGILPTCTATNGCVMIQRMALARRLLVRLVTTILYLSTVKRVFYSDDVYQTNDDDTLPGQIYINLILSQNAHF